MERMQGGSGLMIEDLSVPFVAAVDDSGLGGQAVATDVELLA